jgi:alpha-D-ribose 1-methylphosphonate 5-triphosphate synthase subunit PhnH
MVSPIDLNRLTPGFSDPVQDSRQTFRAILDACFGCCVSDAARL